MSSLSAIGNCQVCGQQMMSHIEEGQDHHWTCRVCIRQRRALAVWGLLVWVVIVTAVAVLYSR